MERSQGITSISINEKTESYGLDNFIVEFEKNDTRVNKKLNNTTQRKISNILTINSTSSTSKNTNNLEQIKKKRAKIQSDHFTSILINDLVEPGFQSNSELYFKSKLKENPELAKEWLNLVFLEHFSNPGIVVKILYIISNLKYEDILPIGPTLAIAALTHEDIEVREFAVRVFENWENPHMLKYIKHMKFEQGWLQDYLEDVISDLEEGN